MSKDILSLKCEVRVRLRGHRQREQYSGTTGLNIFQRFFEPKVDPFRVNYL